MLKKLLCLAALFTLASAGVVRAATITFDSGSFPGSGGSCNHAGTDACQPASASATFYYSGSGNTLTVTLMNKTLNQISDASNLDEIAFTIGGLTSGSATGASGNTIPSITFGTAPTQSAYTSGTSNAPWALSYGSLNGAWGNSPGYTGSAFDLYASGSQTNLGHGSGCVGDHTIVPYSIVGTPSSTAPTETGRGAAQIGSANFLDKSACESTMFDDSATFTLTITGLNATNFAQLGNVEFGFGPDSPNNPDGDDWTAGTPEVTPPVPEPSSLLLLGTGILGAAGMLRRRMARG